METAYEKCGYWLDEVLSYVAENRRVLAEYVLEHLPGLKLYHMDATYFAWIDFSGLGKEEGLEDFLVKECGVAFNARGGSSVPAAERSCGSIWPAGGRLCWRRSGGLKRALKKMENGGSPFHLKRASCPSWHFGRDLCRVQNGKRPD